MKIDTKLKPSKIYFFDQKNKKIIDDTFDKLQQQRKLRFFI